MKLTDQFSYNTFFLYNITGEPRERSVAPLLTKKESPPYFCNLNLLNNKRLRSQDVRGYRIIEFDTRLQARIARQRYYQGINSVSFVKPVLPSIIEIGEIDSGVMVRNGLRKLFKKERAKNQRHNRKK